MIVSVIFLLPKRTLKMEVLDMQKITRDNTERRTNNVSNYDKGVISWTLKTLEKNYPRK